jgi:inorganic triphosphatase YgiF
MSIGFKLYVIWTTQDESWNSFENWLYLMMLFSAKLWFNKAFKNYCECKISAFPWWMHKSWTQQTQKTAPNHITLLLNHSQFWHFKSQFGKCLNLFEVLNTWYQQYPREDCHTTYLRLWAHKYSKNPSEAHIAVDKSQNGTKPETRDGQTLDFKTLPFLLCKKSWKFEDFKDCKLGLFSSTNKIMKVWRFEDTKIMPLITRTHETLKICEIVW